MGKDWSYSKVTEAMAKAGGPEIWIRSIKQQYYMKGMEDAKKKFAIPALIVGFGAGTRYPKFKSWISERRKQRAELRKEAINAEQMLKQELKEE